MANFINTSIEWESGKIPSLDKFIRRIDDSNTKSQDTDLIIVEYDRHKASVEKLEGKRFSISALLGLKRPVEYYSVDIYPNATVQFEQLCKIKHAEYGLMEMVMKFTAGAREGGEAILVKELVRRNTPAFMLEDKIREWVTKEISDDIINLFTNFGSFSARLIKNLAIQAAGIGLRFDVVVTHKFETVPTGETIRLSTKELEIQPKGYNDFLKLGFDAVLVPDKQLQSRTLVTLGYKVRSEFQDLLVKWMQEYIREAISYNEITSYLHFKVRSNLIEYWNKQLRNNHKGWVVAELVLRSGDAPPANFKFERMEIEVALRKAKIPLINTIILNLEDAELFKNKRITNLETWIKEKLQQTAQNILARVSYAELVSRIDQLGSIIKSDLDKQAQQIGYRVEYLLTSDLVDNARLNFHFQFSDEEQVFQTSLNDKVRLNVIISGRIRSLDHDTWRSTLTPETDFVQEMKKEVLRVVRQMLLRINADDFYTKFTDSVEPKLISTIKDLLIQYFNVDHSVDISPQVELSDLGTLIKELQKGISETTINCFKEAKFKVSFSVAAVDPTKWTLFANRSYTTADQVKDAIAERIRIYVEKEVTQTVGVHVMRDRRFPDLIKQYAFDSDLVVREKMGLIIDVIDVETLENGIADPITKDSLDSVKEMIKILMNAIKKTNIKILEAIESGDDEWELKQLRDKKTRLINELETEKFKEYELSYEPGTKPIKNLPHRDMPRLEDSNRNNGNE